MSEQGEFGISKEELTSGAQAVDAVQGTLELFLETADVGRVFGEPVQYEDKIIIPAAEVLTGMGFGMGYGAGSAQGEETAEGEGEMNGPGRGSGSGAGGGGGGAGRTLSRPVAVIIASPDGVQVQPVVDPTKIALAALTAFGFMAGMLFRMQRGARNLELD